MPIVCKTEKYRAEAYDASSPQVCGETGAIALSSLPGCFVPNTPCATFFLSIRPNNLRLNMTTVKVGTPTDVQILEYIVPDTTYHSPNISLAHSTKYCYIPLYTSQSSHRIRLELRQNRTAGGFSLWVQHPFRMKWPPRCLGSSITDGASGASTFTVIPSRKGSSGDSLKNQYIWCSAMDILNGEYFTSNTLSLQGNNSCPRMSLSTGSEAEVDSVASCLRCLKMGLTGCVDDSCKTPCKDSGCGPFGLTKRHWSMLNSSSDNFANCSKDHRCAARMVWKLAESSNDCNGDGFIDCDDIFTALAFTCSSNTHSSNHFSYAERERYWNCRHGNESNFVDIATGNRTLRFFCVNAPDGNTWSKPNTLPNDASYISHNLSFNTIQTPQDNSPLTEDEMVEALKGLKRINATMDSEETQEFVANISKIFQATNKEKTEAQKKANVSSLGQTIEKGMIHVKEGTNIVTPNVALSKFSSIGAILLSEKSTNHTDHFQIPVNSTEEVIKYENKIEAGIILSGYEIDPDVKFVIMIFTDVGEMFPTTESNKSTIREHGDGNVTINSQIVIGVLQNGSTPMRLPQNVDTCIFTQAIKQVGPGQEKCCGYKNSMDGDSVWKTDGCKLVRTNDSFDTCCCNHLSTFAQLLTDAPILTEQQQKSLTISTIVACIVSILGQLGLLVTGVIYKEWRNKPENQMLLNLAVANICLMALMLWRCWETGLPIPHNPCSNEALAVSAGVKDGKPPPTSCWWTGVAMHYIVLANFSWMLVCAVTHVLRIYKAPRGPKVIPHFLLVATTIGWTIPIVPVALIIALDPEGYNITPEIRNYCYPTGGSFRWGVVTPVAVILLLNSIAFILILHVLFPQCFKCFEKQVTRLRQVCGGRKRIFRSVVIVWAFAFLFGLTWVLGLVGYHVFTMYAQCIAVLVQGPTIFVIFVLGERNIRTRIYRITHTIKFSRQRSDTHPIAPSSTEDLSTGRGGFSNNSVPTSDTSDSWSTDNAKCRKSNVNETEM